MISCSLSGSTPPYILPILVIFLSVLVSVSLLALARLTTILPRPRPISSIPLRPAPSPTAHPTHLLVVLGSGGHTAEMLAMLRRLPLLPVKFTYRTYLISSGDAFSAMKADEFEREISSAQSVDGQKLRTGDAGSEVYEIVTIRRARRVHQGLLTTPWSASLCLWDCIVVLQGSHPQRRPRSRQKRPSYPDLIITNGPGTGVCLVLASLLLRFFGFSSSPPTSSPGEQKHNKEMSGQSAPWPHAGQMRTIFIESWARVTTLSLSGKVLLPLVDRFLVQWPGLQGRGGKAEYVESIVA